MEIKTAEDYANGVKKGRRRRVVKLCSMCRERKTKCDLLRPSCQSCSEKALKCVYETQNHHLGHRDEVSLLKKEIALLKIQLLELKAPKGTKFNTKRHQSLIKRKNRLLYSGITSWRSFLHLDATTTYEFYSYFVNSLQKDRSKWLYYQNGGKPKLYDPLTNVPIDQLILNIEHLLPDYDTMLAFIHRFLNGIWLLSLPFLEKEVVVLNFERICHRDPMGKVKIYIDETRTVDYANLALIVTVVKLCLMSEMEFPESILHYKDDEDLMPRFIQKLLEHAKYLFKLTLPSLQTLLLIRILNKFQLKDGDGGDGSNGCILFSVCIGLAYSIGLHQDIDLLYKDESDSHRQVLKNLWNYLLFYDAVGSFDLGMPLSISNESIEISHLDLTDPLVKTMLHMRRACSVMNSSDLTIEALKAQIDELRDYLLSDFEPIFQTMKKHGTLRSLESGCKIAKQVHFSFVLMVMIQHGYQLLYFAYKDIDPALSMKYYDMAIKYTLTLMIAALEYTTRTKLDTTIISEADIITADINYFAITMSRQCFIRCFIFYTTAILLALAQGKQGNYLGLEEDTDAVRIEYKLSELEDLRNDDDPAHHKIKGLTTGLKLLKKVMTQSAFYILYLQTNQVTTDPLNLTTNITDYGLYFILLTMNYIDKAIDKDLRLSSLLKNGQININIIYDSFGDYSPNLFTTNHVEMDEPVTTINDPVWQSKLEHFTEEFFDKYLTNVNTFNGSIN